MKSCSVLERKPAGNFSRMKTRKSIILSHACGFYVACSRVCHIATQIVFLRRAYSGACPYRLFKGRVLIALTLTKRIEVLVIIYTQNGRHTVNYPIIIDDNREMTRP